MKLILRTYNLELKHTFTISRQSFNSKRVLIVELMNNGISGYGEASENPYYKHTVEDMISDLMEVKTEVESMIGDSPEMFWSSMFPLLQKNMFALCALDIAYNDLYARSKGKKLYELWNLSTGQAILSNFTIGIDTVKNMVLKMKETPWPIYKIKLGTPEDLDIVRELRRHTDAVFRIDANGAWGVEETIENARVLKQLGVEFLEQPIAAGDKHGIRHVFKHSVLPIIADESCQVETDIDACFDNFHGVNIKLVKCGGLTPARRMLDRAKFLNMRTMVGCMTESSVGISAIAHLLPLLDYVDMDGALLLRKDIAKGVTIKMGKVTYSNKMGTGVELTDHKPDSMIQ